MQHTRYQRRAFTLIELSVVLVIVGLLVGGVTIGKSMITQARMKGVISDLSTYQNAYNNFKKQYQQLPGDMIDATNYWGTDPDGCPTHTNYVAKKETCNGTGDNYIGYNAPGMPNTTYIYEVFRAWQQLADAGYIQGSFTGVAGTAGVANAVPGLNVPVGTLANSGAYIRSAGYFSSTNMYQAYYGTFIEYGETDPTGFTNIPLITPADTYQIDTKIDDGLPASGILMAHKSNLNANCTTSDTSSATYNLSDKGQRCSLIYILESY